MTIEQSQSTPTSEQSQSTPSRVADERCRICGAEPVPAGRVHGAFSQRDFTLRRCPACGYAFVADPWLDFERIYDERYYAGEGVDPLVDYEFELEQPDRTIRVYEWRGVSNVLESLLGQPSGLRCLDFGCGNGGLVRYLRERLGVDAVGFDEGHIVARARARGIPILTREELSRYQGQFDAVTAIEVLEHTIDPLEELRMIRGLLRPGGLLYLTTGNAAPFRDRLDRWRYVVPEIHISFFEPETLASAMRRTGFRPAFLPKPPIGRTTGFDEVLKFKVLKTLRVHRRSAFTDAIPARIARIADRSTRLREQPIGWAV